MTPQALDPGLVLWLCEREQISPLDLATVLEHRSGLLALTGTPDMREIERRVDAGDPQAQLGFDVFVGQLAKGIGAMTVAAGGIDALVFTGGIGEHSPAVRAATSRRLAHLGIAIDDYRNYAADDAPDRDISAVGSSVRTLVITSREDLTIARAVRETLGAS